MRSVVSDDGTDCKLIPEENWYCVAVPEAPQTRTFLATRPLAVLLVLGRLLQLHFPQGFRQDHLIIVHYFHCHLYEEQRAPR